jgi:plastocyanin
MINQVERRRGLKNNKTRRFYVLGLVVMAIVLTACSASRSARDNSYNNAKANEDNTKVNVVAKDFSYSLDTKQAKAGEITFIVQNDDSMHHDFAIQGNGVERKTPMIALVENASFTVDLKPGTYTYVCTVPGHEQLGMRGAFTLTSNGLK